MSWQELGDDDEQDDEDPALTLGDLRDGEATTVTVDAEPERFESEQYGEGVRVPVTFRRSDYPHAGEDGETFEDGTDCVLITWSKRLVRELARYDEDEGGLVGDTVEIIKSGSGYSTDYTAHAVEE